MPTWRVRDSITIERVWYVEAETEDEATAWADNHADQTDHEEQIGNDPYEAALLDEEGDQTDDD